MVVVACITVVVVMMVMMEASDLLLFYFYFYFFPRRPTSLLTEAFPLSSFYLCLYVHNIYNKSVYRTMTVCIIVEMYE